MAVPSPIESFSVSGDSYLWLPSPAEEAVTTYNISKSQDGGTTWSIPVTIANSFAGPNFDSAEGRFFWLDPMPGQGEIVRINATSLVGSGIYSYVYGDLAPFQVCNIYGQFVDAVSGEPMRQIICRATPISGYESARQFQNAGFSGIKPRAVFGVNRQKVVLADDLGRLNFNAIRGTILRITVPATGVDQVIKVPEQELLNISDLNLHRFGSDQRTQPEYASYSGPIKSR